MNKKGNNKLDLILSILLLIATIAIIILQILFSTPESTKIETSLFSVLQFVFSLAFSWVLARISLREEFQESQKKFAISAYRRIIEINNAVNRLINRTTLHMGKTEIETNHELDVINEIGVGIRESIKSSVSDWADIIGDEIETVEKIQAIREKQYYEQVDGKPIVDESHKNNQDSDTAVENLISKLPNSLKLTANELDKYQSSKMSKVRAKLRREEKKKGYIELDGRYESSFDRDIYDFKEGDILQVMIADTNGRTGALIAFDDSGKSVGVILNKLTEISDGYFDFVGMLFRHIGKSKFQIQILDIDRSEQKDKNIGIIHWFTAKIIDSNSKNA